MNSILNKPWLHGDVRKEMPLLARYSLFIGAAGVIMNIIFFITNCFYEWVIPFFEKSDSLSDEAFNFFDNLVFYFPLIMIVVFVAYGFWGYHYCERKYQRIVSKMDTDYREAADAEIKALEDEEAFLKRKFLTNCPNCGAARADRETHCRYCGADLEIYSDKQS